VRLALLSKIDAEGAEYRLALHDDRRILLQRNGGPWIEYRRVRQDLPPLSIVPGLVGAYCQDYGWHLEDIDRSISGPFYIKMDPKKTTV
jgi:hypothetical protein